MTEIPEHLLARSRARKGGAATPGPSTAPAVAGDSAAPEATTDATPATKPAAAPPAPPKVDLPEVAFEKARPKIPVWASAMLAALPVWAIMYAFTLDPETPKELGPLDAGAQVYSTGANCAGCHGATGGGSSSVPQLADGAVLETFPTPAEQIRWVFLGSDAYKSEVGPTYGATNKTVKGGMPGFGAQLSGKDMMDVVLHERTTLSKEEFDIEAWKDVVATVEEIDPAKASEYDEVIKEWEAKPPVG